MKYLILSVIILNLNINFQSALFAQNLSYHSANEFKLVGSAFATNEHYERLPKLFQFNLRPALWEESTNSSGIAIQFSTNSSIIAVKWKTGDSSHFPHVAETLVKGVDLYCKKNNKWYFAGLGKPYQKENQTAILVENMDTTLKNFMLYLPMYETVDSIYIGINEGSVIAPPKSSLFMVKNPIVFYGTSIVQGASASRPGMAYPSIISRALNIETINLGFSGNGLLELPIAEIMGKIKASCYVIDCGPNLTPELAKERTIPFIQHLHTLQPTIPIVLVANIIYPTALFNQKLQAHVNDVNLNFINAFKYIKSKNITNVYYIDSNNLIGDDGEATVDGIHLSDLGFYRISTILESNLKRILHL